MARVVFLGVGGWISEPFLGHTSFAVVGSSGEWIVVEAGEGLYASMRRCNFDLDDVFRGVVVSHRHGDHILGLPTILQMAKHRGFGKVMVISIDDAIDAVRELLDATGSQNVFDIADLRAVEMRKRVDVGGFGIEFIDAIHSVPAASVKIYVDGLCIVYSGDTVYNPELARFARGCRLLIHEASGYYEEAYRYGHSSYTDAIATAIEAGVDILALVHFYLQPQPVATSSIKGGSSLKILVPQPCTSIEL
ncbi:MAG: ribonuclease Z [Ignisphaera sp.]|uniref:Ribonuclease Z n=1 Tax=Ignisphaera aggregans TaxID=334771 RepID=A0A7J3I572_9CREN